jgi:hypothetical protein
MRGLREVSISVMPLTLNVEVEWGTAGKCGQVWRKCLDLLERPTFPKLPLRDG